MPEKPDLIVLRRHRDLEGRTKEAWIRRGLLLVVGVFVLAGLANVFGQRASNAKTSGAPATLEVRSPTSLRGGLLFQARFTVRARRSLEKATLVLDRGWLEGMTINTVEPGPVGEASRNGELALELGHVPAGDSFVLYIQVQVNPTDIGRRTQTTTLFDGDTRLLAIRRSVNVFP